MGSQFTRRRPGLSAEDLSCVSFVSGGTSGKCDGLDLLLGRTYAERDEI